MAPVRRDSVVAEAAKYAILHGDTDYAKRVIPELSDVDRWILANDIGALGGAKAASVICPALTLGDCARLSKAIVRAQITAGDFDLAATTAAGIDEVGERAVAFAALALAAASRGRLDLVTAADNEIAAMRSYGVDAVQIADSEITLLFAYSILSRATRQHDRPRSAADAFLVSRRSPGGAGCRRGPVHAPDPAGWSSVRTRTARGGCEVARRSCQDGWRQSAHEIGLRIVACSWHGLWFRRLRTRPRGGTAFAERHSVTQAADGSGTDVGPSRHIDAVCAVRK